jgi:hypothetical protein
MISRMSISGPICRLTIVSPLLQDSSIPSQDLGTNMPTQIRYPNFRLFRLINRQSTRSNQTWLHPSFLHMSTELDSIPDVIPNVG